MLGEGGGAGRRVAAEVYGQDVFVNYPIGLVVPTPSALCATAIRVRECARVRACCVSDCAYMPSMLTVEIQSRWPAIPASKTSGQRDARARLLGAMKEPYCDRVSPLSVATKPPGRLSSLLHGSICLALWGGVVRLYQCTRHERYEGRGEVEFAVAPCSSQQEPGHQVTGHERRGGTGRGGGG